MTGSVPTKGDKERAGRQLRNAVRSGKVVRPTSCEACGHKEHAFFTATKLHAHHTDYMRPFDVRWLCSRCHIQLHGAMGSYRGNRRRHKEVAA